MVVQVVYEWRGELNLLIYCLDLEAEELLMNSVEINLVSDLW